VPVLVTYRMVDGVVWLPTNSVGCAVRTELGVEAGAPVDVARSASPVSPAELGTASPSAQTSEANVDPIPRVTPESSERPPR
jgi:NADH-quinone oxidoreductase subunit G